MKKILPFLLILALAAFFRFYQIQSYPGGLFPDEAANGLDALNILSGKEIQPFYERGNGREGLFFYIIALAIKFFGNKVWVLHLVSASVGFSAVLFTYLLVKKLFNSKVAFFASLFLTTSSWHVSLSRSAFRANLTPLFTSAFFYFAYLALFSKKKRFFTILSGMVFGLGFYTYIAFRMMIFILVFWLLTFLIYDWLKNKGIYTKKYYQQFLLFLAVVFITLLPLAFYFYQHPEFLLTRSGQVSIFNPDLNKGDVWGTFLDVLKKTFFAFFTLGDENWRHNVSGFAFLNPLVAVFFAIGVLYSTHLVFYFIFKKQKDFYAFYLHFLLLLWFFFMLVPEVTTAEGIPHGLRLIGVIPVVFIFSGIAFAKFYERFIKIKERKIVFALFVFVLFLAAFYDYYLFFQISLKSSDYYYAYRGDLTPVSDYLNERNNKEATYLVLDAFSEQTPQFLTAENNQPYILLDPATSWRKFLRAGEEMIFTQSTIYDANKYRIYHPESKIKERKYNQFGEEIMRIVTL